METNLQQNRHSTNIPAGIFIGTEIFAHEDEIYAIHKGVRMEFQELPSFEKRNFIQMYLNDKAGQTFIHKQFGITGFESQFKKWLFCNFGSLDGNPDSISNKVSADTYNSACLEKDCPGRGRFCGKASGLKSHEVQTLRLLKQGKTSKEIANILCVSEAAIKSRLSKLKELHNVTNAMALVAIATELGI